MDSAGGKEEERRRIEEEGWARQRGTGTEKKLWGVNKNKDTLPCSRPSGPRVAGPPAAKQQ